MAHTYKVRPKGKKLGRVFHTIMLGRGQVGNKQILSILLQKTKITLKL